MNENDRAAMREKQVKEEMQTNGKQAKNQRNIELHTKLKQFFWEQKGCIWISVLFIGIIAIGWAWKADLHPERGNQFIRWEWWPEMRHKLWQASEMVCNVVIAYSAMLATVVTFYYSVTGNKRWGIPYRRLIMYNAGSWTIPVLFVAILLLTVFVAVAQHMPWKHTMYVCVIYILLLQTYVIIEILRSTSHAYGKWVICGMERKKYGKERESSENDSIRWIYSAGHLEQAIHSEEFIQDKKDLLMEFLRIPFQLKKGELSYNNLRQEVFVGKEELERIYLFYFLNISSAFQNLGGEEKQIERNELYLCIGGFLKEVYGLVSSNGKGKAVYNMVLSGIINGMVYSGVEDTVVFCDYVFSDHIPSELEPLQLRLYVLFQEVMCMFEEKPGQRNLRIRKLSEWEPIREKEDISVCAYYWNIWVKMFHIPLVSKVKHFRAAMQTITGYGNESPAVLEMLLPMGRER